MTEREKEPESKRKKPPVDCRHTKDDSPHTASSVKRSAARVNAHKTNTVNAPSEIRARDSVFACAHDYCCGGARRKTNDRDRDRDQYRTVVWSRKEDARRKTHSSTSRTVLVPSKAVRAFVRWFIPPAWRTYSVLIVLVRGGTE